MFSKEFIALIKLDFCKLDVWEATKATHKITCRCYIVIECGFTKIYFCIIDESIMLACLQESLAC